MPSSSSQGAQKKLRQMIKIFPGIIVLIPGSHCRSKEPESLSKLTFLRPYQIFLKHNKSQEIRN